LELEKVQAFLFEKGKTGWRQSEASNQKGFVLDINTDNV
jgi:hypothetical protein